jgi:hypothetical protein
MHGNAAGRLTLRPIGNYRAVRGEHRADQAGYSWGSRGLGQGKGLMPTVFVVASLLLGDPRLTLEDAVFQSRMACQVFMQQQYDAWTIEVFRLDCVPKTNGH